MDEELRWFWRNCRELSVRVNFQIWPWLAPQAGKEETVHGGARWVAFGPFVFVLDYGIGNCSAYGIEAWGALSQMDAEERAIRYQAAD